jgi:hypothetical protein
MKRRTLIFIAERSGRGTDTFGKRERIMARSTRVFFQSQVGVIRKNHNWGAINVDSAVIITAASFAFDPSQTTKTQGRPILTDNSSVYVTNVGPHGGHDTGEAGGVEYHLHVDGDPQDVVVTITVVEDIESWVFA